MEQKKSRLKICIPIIGMVIGILILLYPMMLDLYHEHLNKQAISSMSSVYDRYGDNAEEIERQLKMAEDYNLMLSGRQVTARDYEEQLTFDGNGIMGYIEIPCINVNLLIYRGTGKDVLAIGAGHLEGTSLPIGGESTHSVITAHSGMKNMSAFDNLRLMKEGDIFTVSVLGRKCTYMVDRIETVLPHETDSLKIMEGEDRVTLVTCTPYGINDHRLLVHGVRAELSETGEEEPESEDVQSNHIPENRMVLDMRTIPVICALAVVVVTVLVAVVNRRKEKKK